jgi:hypothetical protein
MSNFGLARVKPEGTMVVGDNCSKLPPLPYPEWIYPNGVYLNNKHYTRKEYAKLLIKQQVTGLTS